MRSCCCPAAATASELNTVFPALNFMHFVACSSSDVIARKRANGIWRRPLPLAWIVLPLAVEPLREVALSRASLSNPTDRICTRAKSPF